MVTQLELRHWRLHIEEYVKTSYIRYGRRHPIPPTVQIRDELRAGYTPGYVPKSKRAAPPPMRAPANQLAEKQRLSRESTHRPDQESEVSNWENDGGASISAPDHVLRLARGAEPLVLAKTEP